MLRTTPRILFVDDDDSVRRATTRLFTMHGLDVISVASARSARGLLDAGAEFDLFLLDLEIGEDNGVELMREIHERLPNAKVGLWSGSADLSVIDAAAHLAAEFVLVKGIPSTELMGIVNAVLGRRSVIQESCSR
jgi:DNA-binding NtrC family response regulator